MSTQQRTTVVPEEIRARLTFFKVMAIIVGIGLLLLVLGMILRYGFGHPTLNGLNAGVTFIGVLLGPLLAPHWVRWAGIRNLVYAVQWWVFAAFVAFMWWRMVSEPPGSHDERPEAETSTPRSVG